MGFISRLEGAAYEVFGATMVQESHARGVMMSKDNRIPNALFAFAELSPYLTVPFALLSVAILGSGLIPATTLVVSAFATKALVEGATRVTGFTGFKKTSYY